jgi:hypothetical protein
VEEAGITFWNQYGMNDEKPPMSLRRASPEMRRT